MPQMLSIEFFVLNVEEYLGKSLSLKFSNALKVASQCALMSVFWPRVSYCIYSYGFLHVYGNSCSNRSIMKMPGLPLMHFSACHHSATAATSATFIPLSSAHPPASIYISLLVIQTCPSPSPFIIDPNPWKYHCSFLLLSLSMYLLTMQELVLLCMCIEYVAAVFNIIELKSF